MSNWAEYIAGTNPTNAASYLKVEQVTFNSPAQISFQALSNRTYTIQYKNHLNDPAWLKLADVLARTSNRVEVVTDPTPVTNRFYRVATPQSP